MMPKSKGNIKQRRHLRKARSNRTFSKKSMITNESTIQNDNNDNLSDNNDDDIINHQIVENVKITNSLTLTDTNLHQNSLADTIDMDDYQNSDRQILIDQIISLTCELPKTSIVLLKEIAQQLTTDQYSEHDVIDK